MKKSWDRIRICIIIDEDSKHCHTAVPVPVCVAGAGGGKVGYLDPFATTCIVKEHMNVELIIIEG